VRWVGWIVVAVALAAMAFARLTDDTDRVGRDPDWAPASEAAGPSVAPADGEAPTAHPAAAVSESL
jgi:hypothetical protein